MRLINVLQKNTLDQEITDFISRYFNPEDHNETIVDTGTIRTSQELDRETRPHYWLTVIAQDMALVPKFARLEVLVTVDDVNDNVPQSLEPAYYASVQENLNGAIQEIVRIQASDGDYDGSQRLSYSLTAGNSDGFFQIDEDTASLKSSFFSRFRSDFCLGLGYDVTHESTGTPLLGSMGRQLSHLIQPNSSNLAMSPSG
ncbi:hypothetical protein RRG08_048592 [Elysia crispata]|uniref:Cadherin domain-containing protein n=1 Tax=Elysia crispata TaxID=231223 RepID=A0AAE1AE93_9GAST|nr:hypothetical protein RRG08_048592 [Elysia crispata]